MLHAGMYVLFLFEVEQNQSFALKGKNALQTKNSKENEVMTAAT